jgi:hypothetical protein
VETLRLRAFLLFLIFVGGGFSGSVLAEPQSSPASCKIQPASFEGWKAQQISNQWVTVTIVPQLGGRVMQVTFGNHPYLFVNSQLRGKYFPPSEAAETQKWFNYGGDKIWPLPEGSQDAQHWPGPISDVLDDGTYDFRVLSQDAVCTVRLEGPADPRTGLQYSRDISLGSDSPEITFHAVMKNATEHPIRWSMQSVTQYDTADARNSAMYNRDFWALTPINPHSAYTDGYRVRAGLADDPSFAVNDGRFTLHWLYLENEVWLDSDAGWIAVVDNPARFAMIERFQYASGAEYPGKASVIFYKNGASLELDEKGMPTLRSAHWQEAPYYMEAEINSPMISLDPGASYAMDTRWFPARAGRELKAVTLAGIVERPITANFTREGVYLFGAFSVFFPGKLSAHIADPQGVEVAVVELQPADPLTAVELNQTIPVPKGADSVSIHLNDPEGGDRGSLGEAKITNPENVP